MGLTFRNKTSLGAPVAGDIKEREIAFDLKDNSLYSSTDGADLVKIDGNPEVGGILHDIGIDYDIGDMVNLDGSNFIYVCKATHTSTVDCNLAPDDASWYQPAVPYYPVTYYFTSDLLGQNDPALAPTGPHDATPATPDENGPYYFSIALGVGAKPCEVVLEGFELYPVDYDLTTDGYLKILSPVADNSRLKVVI